MKARLPSYAWVNAALPGRTLLDPSVEWPVTLARYRKPQWRYPISLIDPLTWYWTYLSFYDDPNALQGAHARGASWYELAMDFEISTRIPLSRRGPENAIEIMRERAGLMSDASKAPLR